MRRRRHSRAFKLAAIARMEATLDVAGLARELGIDRGLLYKWSKAYAAEGESGLRLGGERRLDPALAGPVAAETATAGPAALRRIAELERKVARQALELDFFQEALRHVAGSPRRGGPGGKGSTP